MTVAGGDALRDEAEAFAQRLSDTVSGFVGKPCPFRADVFETGRFSVAEEGEGIQLTVGGVAMLSLEVNYQCEWNSSNTYMAVHSSRVAVHAGGRPKGNPLFRYEYERGLGHDLPSAHLQVHAHRDAFAHVMSTAGRKAHSGQARDTLALGSIPELSTFHFPLGGHRFRPCLEDLLASLKAEFGLDAAADWREALAAGRLQWRRQQLAAAVSDCPEEAARALESLGYVVTRAEGKPPPRERVDRMTAL